jgi:hypothetical protein
MMPGARFFLLSHVQPFILPLFTLQPRSMEFSEDGMRRPTPRTQYP